MDRETFVHSVKEALNGFYDAVRLQTSPLVEALALPPGPSQTMAQALRQALREAIETLRPAESIPFSRPEWTGYRLLTLRYIRSASRFDTCQELGLSPASFYRRHQEAIEAVTDILWRRCPQQITAPPAAAPEASQLQPCERARLEAIRLARESQLRSIDLAQLLEGVRRTIQPLADQEGVALRIEMPDSPPHMYADAATLRQILLNVLTESLKLVLESTLEMIASHEGNQMVWRLRGLNEACVPQSLQALPGFAVSQGLLHVYGGSLWLERGSPGRVGVVFALPIARPRTILAVDDDADMMTLYRRFLQVYGFMLREARSSAQMQAVLAESRPDLILLDLLMPHEDGWDILQHLKSSPSTADIPVIVCSVLSQPSLALALGATTVLQKPITEQALLRATQEILRQGGSEG